MSNRSKIKEILHAMTDKYPYQTDWVFLATITFMDNQILQASEQDIADALAEIKKIANRKD